MCYFLVIFGLFANGSEAYIRNGYLIFRAVAGCVIFAALHFEFMTSAQCGKIMPVTFAHRHIRMINSGMRDTVCEKKRIFSC